MAMRPVAHWESDVTGRVVRALPIESVRLVVRASAFLRLTGIRARGTELGNWLLQRVALRARIGTWTARMRRVIRNSWRRRFRQDRCILEC